jgi:hypothetical protein
MRQYATFENSVAEPSVGMTPFQARANALASRRKYRTGWFSNAGHNCSRVRLFTSSRDSRGAMTPETNFEMHRDAEGEQN